jgi:hypothetical protein
MCICALALLIGSCNKTVDDSTYPGFRVTFNGQRYVADTAYYVMTPVGMNIYAYTGGQKKFSIELLGQTATTYNIGILGSGSNSVYYTKDSQNIYSSNGVASSGLLNITKFTDSTNRYSSSKYTDSTTHINGNFYFTVRKSNDSVICTSGYFNLLQRH